MTIELDMSPRYRVQLPVPADPADVLINLMLVGCGGTGSALAPLLGQLGYHARKKGMQLNFTFVDPDVVEEKNIGRQRFSTCEIGSRKAEVLAMRLNAAYGLDIGAICRPFQADMLRYFRRPRHGAVARSLLIGAVDNNAARHALHRAIQRERGRVWGLDLGNARDNGHIIIGNTTRVEEIQFDEKLGFCTGLPSPYLQEPLLLETEPEDDQNLSCAALTVLEEQSLLINTVIAALAARHLADFILHGLVEVVQVRFALSPLSVRTVPVSHPVSLVMPAGRALFCS